MSKKKKIILITVGVIALIALLLVLLYANRRELESESTRNYESGNEMGGGDKEKLESENRKLDQNAIEVSKKQFSPEEIEEENIKNLAKSFVERWGSWSTDGDYSNFESLKVHATDDMKKEIDEYKKKLETRNWKLKTSPNPSFARRGSVPSPLEGEGQGEVGFYGVTTKALSAKIEEKFTDSAKIKVVFQKQETFGEEVKISYGEMSLEMKKEGEKWVITQINADVKAD